MTSRKGYDKVMRMAKARVQLKQVPLIVERDEDGFYVVECPLFDGCYTQGKTVDEALDNIKEVIQLCLEEKNNRELAQTYHPREFSFHTISL